uniref:Nucleolar protein 56 n=1 Tax=Lepeophtheirus salmonis TaxID=72036 RepID=A0A0K2SWR9_LEPSM
MSVQFALFEHASGYGLFKVKEFEEIGVFQSEVEASLSDVSSFNKIVSLASFLPFKTAGDALNNINAVSEGIATDDAKLFVKTHLPKKKGVVLGVLDPKLGAALADDLGIKVSHVGVVPEVIRGIRHHFAKLVKGMNAEASKKSQLGLGHSYSRAKVKFNVHKADNMIIQSIALLDQLDKDVNTFAMRIREWYSYHFPELIKIVNDNYTFARCVKVVKNRKEINDETLEKLEAVLMDSGKAKAIIEASKSSMGMDISIIDLMHIEQFADRVIGLAEYRKELSVYLQKKMESVAPNLATLIGDSVAARLISHAGSLTNLAKYPASTVQILGAEKALFRALKTKGNTPKYGLIFHSSFIGKAGAKNKGRISRYLANKCSIASRIDCFSEIPTDVFGKKLKEQVEDRLKFYETGEIPKKNIEVMQEAIQAVKEEADSFKVVKKDKKKKKRKAEEMENEEEVKVKEEVDSPKKKKRKVVKEEENTAEDESEAVTPKNKKKKKSKKKESDD